MKPKDIRNMGKIERDEKIVELRRELMKQNAQVAAGTTPKSPGQIRTLKRTIAKILTEKQKEVRTQA